MREGQRFQTTRTIGLVIALFVAGLVPVVLPSAAARAQGAQSGKTYRIGFLRAGHPPPAYLEGLQQGLQEGGYVYGQSIVVELRTTDGSIDQLPMLAEDLLRSKVDVILASAGPAALAAKNATTS